MPEIEKKTGHAKDRGERHLVAFSCFECDIYQATKELDEMGIDYECNDMSLYKYAMPSYSVFVFGDDYLKLDDFKKRHIHEY